MHLELAQHHRDAGRGLDRLEGRVHRAVARGAALDAAAVAVLQTHQCPCRAVAARLGRELDQSPGPAGGALGAQHQRLDVAVEQLLLLVRQRLEFLEHTVEFRLIELEPERADALAERVPAAVLAEHQVSARQADILGAQDLVGRVVLEHPVLVNAGFVREGVFTHHRLVARDRHAGDAGDEPRGGVEAAGMNAGADVEERGARLQRHHHFLQRAVAGALADAVDGALDLPCAGDHRREAVGDRHAEVVVAVDGEPHRLDAAYVLAQVTEQLRKLIRHRVADRVRDVHRGGPGADRHLDHLGEELELGARGILGGELHVLAQLARAGHAGGAQTQDFLLRHVELVLAVNGAGGEEHVDAVTGSLGERARGELDVLEAAARQGADDRTLHFACHRLHAVEVAARGGRETRLDDVHAELGERARHAQLLGPGHAAPRGLLAVAQRGVEDQHSIWIYDHGSLPVSLRDVFPAATACGPAAPRRLSRSGDRRPG